MVRIYLRILKILLCEAKTESTEIALVAAVTGAKTVSAGLGSAREFLVLLKMISDDDGMNMIMILLLVDH